MPEITTPSAREPFRHRDFNLFMSARFVTLLAMEMQSVAVGWQIYAATHRSLDLGFVGLALFFPSAGLSLFSGHVADRFDRRRILLVCYALNGLLSLGLFALGSLPTAGVAPVYGLLFLLGTTRAFANPAGQALLPNLVPREHLRSAVAWGSTVWQLATIIGPGLGGVLIAPIGVSGVYLVSALGFFLAMAFFVFVSQRPPLASADGASSPRKGVSFETLAAGMVYVWQNKMVLGAISLDLFAVLLGGAVALMPAFAIDILHVGPRGMGALRSAPAVGAVLVAVLLAYFPIKRRAGLLMFSCVFVFGIATIVFGLSHTFLVSVLALAVVGGSDMVSVVIRQTLIQINTPEAVRGRVSAVNMVFIGASNELGQFESGVTAQWLGLVPAVIVGGIGTCLVVVAWAALFPALRKAQGLERPESPSAA